MGLGVADVRHITIPSIRPGIIVVVTTIATSVSSMSCAR